MSLQTPEPPDLDAMTDYGALSPEVVIQAIESTGRLSDARVLTLNSYENRVFQVGIDESLPIIAKFYRPGRWSDEQLREEHQFSLELAKAELPIVAPLTDADGETLFRYEGYRFALFPRKGGGAPEPGDLDQLHRIGVLLGRLHAIGRQWKFTHRVTLTTERFLDIPAAQVCQAGFVPDTLRDRYQKVIGELRQKITAVGINDFPMLRTQGDCHLGNVLWTRDDGPWLVDFDDCQTAPAVQDLWMLLCGERHERELQLCELLDGYTQFCDFDARELRLIEPLRALRYVHYAGWLASRWTDPAFPRYFPWFNTQSYWQQHIAELELQCGELDEPSLRRL